ncbi:MAG: hypothetical protein U9O89_03935 [Thermoproteota archaeon]|nr:hypothetical protein [Thermoproteota archaeon]
MEKLTITFFLCIFLIFCIKPAYAPIVVSVQAEVNEKVHVVFQLVNITDYQLIKNQSLITDSTIPEAIINQTQLCINYSVSDLSFNDSTCSINVVFDLYGLDVLNSTLNMNTMTKICSLRTDWRKFHLNLTDGFPYNFTKYFGTPIAQWQNRTDDEGRRCFVYSHDNLSFLFKLPTSAKNVHVAEDNETIVFEVSLSKGDNLLNSPFLVLIAVVVANIVAFIYRKTKRGTA